MIGPRPVGANAGRSGTSARTSPAPCRSPAHVGMIGSVSLAGGGGGIMPTVGSLHMPPHAKLGAVPKAPPHPPGSSGVHLTSSSAIGGVVLQQQHIGTGAGLRTLNQPTVVASPLKVPVSQLPHAVQHNLSSWSGGGGLGEIGRLGSTGGGGGGGREEVRERTGNVLGAGVEAGGGGGTREPATMTVAAEISPPKRIRLTRKAAAGMGNPED